MSAKPITRIKFTPKTKAIKKPTSAKSPIAKGTPSAPLIVQYDITPDMIVDPDIAYKLVGDSHVTGLARLYLKDAKVVMPIRDAIFHLILWRIYHRFNIPIESTMVHPRRPWHSGALADLQTKVMYDIRRRLPHTREQMCDALFEYVNYLYNFVATELNAYVNTLDILSLAKLINHPDIKDGLVINYNAVLGTDVVEKAIVEKNKILQQKLKDPNLLTPAENQLRIPLEIKEINLMQLPQMAIAYGPRTDVDDTMVLRPVLANTLNGLKDILDYATESLAAKKSAFYNNVAIKRSQYFGRKQHILTSSMTHIYQQDCGSTNHITFTVTDVNWPNLLGVNALDPLTGQYYILSEDNLPNLVGTDIRIRNPLSCRHTDGACIRCGGDLFLNIDARINIGMLGSIQVIEPCTQRILSAKHLVKTNSLYYTLPAGADKYFYRINANEIQWKPDRHKKLTHMEMGITLKDMMNIHDIMVSPLEGDKVREERFSKLHEVLLRNTKTGAMEQLSLTDGKVSPFFTVDMLRFIRDHLQKGLVIGDTMFWIPLAGTENFSIMKALVLNDSMLQFVSSVSGFLSKGIAKYKSANAVLKDFSNIVYTKVSNAHISHMGTILKAYMVTSDTDFRIPSVTDVDNVKFKTTSTIITHRTLGGQLAFQDLARILRTPSTYIVPRCDSVFDPLFNINPEDTSYK